MRGHQTPCCGEERPFAVTFDRATFQHEVQTVDILPLHDACFVHLMVDGIVIVSREFLSPAVETIVEQAVVPHIIRQGKKTMIARPCIIGRTDEAHHISRGILRSHDDESFTLGNLTCHLVISLNNVIEDGGPVGIGMRPRELHTPLGLPFSWKSPFTDVVFCLHVHILVQRYKKFIIHNS